MSLKVSRNGGASIEPVSYTHLDVYKRQLLYYKCVRCIAIYTPCRTPSVFGRAGGVFVYGSFLLRLRYIA